MKATYVWLPIVVISSFLAGTLVTAGRAQQSARKPPKYIEVDYMKAAPGHENEYVKLEQEQWKPMHQERIKQGKLHAWYFFGVDFPSGSENKYNFITINAFDQWGQMENPYADLAQLFQKAHPGASLQDLGAQTGKARDIVRSEVWELIDEAE